MDSGLIFRYDPVGDILYVDAVQPYAAQESDMVDPFVVARTNPETGTVENLEILFFTERAREKSGMTLPLHYFSNLERAS